jgi:quercetin dioxygenase-like cupin family protein
VNVRARQLENPVSRERISFLHTGAETGGRSFLFEVVAPPETVPPPAHVHAGEEERVEVLGGQMTARVAGHETVLRAGDSCVWAAGSDHTWWNSGAGELRFRAEFRPAGNMQSFFETYCGLAAEGRCDDKGQPPLLQVAASFPLWGMYLHGPPILAQRMLMAVLRPLAWLRGYRARYERFESAGNAGTMSAVARGERPQPR